MKILVTGAAGFIGSKLAYELAKRGDTVIGIDNMNTYYDPMLKYARLKAFFGLEIDPTWKMDSAVPATSVDGKEVTFPVMPDGFHFTSPELPNLSFERIDITDTEALNRFFERERPDKVMNLAAQAGVRYSIKNPMAYVQSNVVGFTNLLECARRYEVKNFVYASSSSVYGGNTKVPFAESDRVDAPVSLYAATKKSNELFAHVYSKLYGIPTTGLRFFTVYGPWGRPDMATLLFANAIMTGKPINVFNNGDLSRDFTYIDDIVKGTIAVIDHIPAGEIPAKVYNIGCGHPSQLMDYITEIENGIGMEAKKVFMPMQPGDVYRTYADTTELAKDTGYKPTTSLHEGIKTFSEWYQAVYVPAFIKK